jgi:pimeloyl-ACP methyl ester carboxylesterase
MDILSFVVSVALVLMGLVAILLLLFVLFGLLVHLAYRGKPWADEVYAAQTPDGWKIRLYRHKPKKSRGRGAPVLLVPGLIANHYEFEEPRGRSLVDALKARGYDCWVLDTRGHRSSTPPPGNKEPDVTLEDHVFLDLPTAIDYVRAATGYGRVHYVGHSLGGMLLYMYDAIYGCDDIASAATIGSPVSFQSMDARKFRHIIRLSKGGRRILGTVARVVAPLGKVFKPKMRLLPVDWKNVHPEVGGRAFYNIADWPPNSLRDQLVEMVKTKSWRIRHEGEDVNIEELLGNLDVPLLAIYGGGDTLVPMHEAQAFFDRLPQEDKSMLVLSRENGYVADYNHIDLVLG